MPSQRSFLRLQVLIFACALSLSVAGCGKEHARATVPVAEAPVAPSLEPVRPMTTAPDTDAKPPIEAAAEAPTIPSPAEPPAPVVITPTKPPAPRRPPEEHPVEADAQPAEHRAPQISPQISPTQQSQYERKTNENIAAAERNLKQTKGKTLSAAQQDLADKIRSFLAQSRDASKGGDWDRAQNLAQKARLLSNELLNSL